MIVSNRIIKDKLKHVSEWKKKRIEKQIKKLKEKDRIENNKQLEESENNRQDWLIQVWMRIDRIVEDKSRLV